MKNVKVIVNIVILLCLALTVSVGCKDFDRRTQFNTTYTNRVVLDSNNTMSASGEVSSDTLIVDFIGTVEDHSSTENSIESVKLVSIGIEIDRLKSPSYANFNVLKDLEVYLKGKGMDEILIGSTDSIPSNIRYFEIKVIPVDEDFEDLVKTEEYTCRVKFTPNSKIADSSYVVKITPTYLIDTKKFGV
jgi:hypothetical protein